MFEQLESRLSKMGFQIGDIAYIAGLTGLRRIGVGVTLESRRSNRSIWTGRSSEGRTLRLRIMRQKLIRVIDGRWIEVLAREGLELAGVEVGEVVGASILSEWPRELVSIQPLRRLGQRILIAIA